ncbi:hemerythrin domain-containing protein [Sphingomonas koreensis]|jgi:hemerythrin superfamily protein|uniref:Hemerythrin domain-containing protein n=1 Tax=Sphingomonas koreensis TaxID=93064 RepID=A0A430FZ05_9SPHN|nr:hemerythrin domain-containing protein [Sphingomonas koreensis]RSY77898.1 hemerythrin domain-containing protein [Sphingomonas koreensis]
MATTTQARDSKGRFKEENGSWFGGYGPIAGAVAGGAALGVLAMLGRKAAVQSATALAGDWMDGLIAEHQAVLKLFDAIEATDDKDTGRRTMLLMQIKHALAKHAIEEENVIYPALREAGKIEEADALTKEHGYVKQYLYELENMPKTGPAFLEKVRKFRADLEEHMDEEEERLFPALRTQLTEEKNALLTKAMNKEGFKVA